MKKFISFALASVMAFSMASCGGSNASGENAEGTESSDQLVVWAWDQNIPIVEYAVEQYHTDNPDSTVEVDIQNVPDTVSKVSTFLAAGTTQGLPDLVLMDNLQIQTFLQQFPDSFVNLSEMGFDEYKDDFSESQWDLLSQDGNIYAFPFDIAPVMIIANNEILDAAGVDINTLNTWDDFIAANTAITEAGYASFIRFTETEVLDMLQSADVGMFDEEGNIDLLNPKAVEVVEKYLEIANSNTSDSVLTDSVSFGDGEVAFLVAPAWMVGENMPVQTGLDGKVSLIPFPAIEEGDGYTHSAVDGGSSFIILETSQNKEAAYEIGKYISTDLEAQNIALENGLMPGYLPSNELDAIQAPVDYYQGQAIWADLLESSKGANSINVNEDYALAKEIFKGTLVDQVNVGTDKTATELLQETADNIAIQTGRTINEY